MEKLMKSGKIDAGNAEEIFQVGCLFVFADGLNFGIIEHHSNDEFQALIIWTEADKDNRLQHLQKLMEPNIGLLSHNVSECLFPQCMHVSNF